MMQTMRMRGGVDEDQWWVKRVIEERVQSDDVPNDDDG